MAEGDCVGGEGAGEQAAQAAGGQRRARTEAPGKGRVEDREGGQAVRGEGGRGRGAGRAGDARVSVQAAGFMGSKVRRGQLARDGNVAG